MADDNKSPSPEAGPSAAADNDKPDVQQEQNEEPTGEFARGNSKWAQLERNPIRYFQFLKMDLYVGMVLYNIRSEARKLRENGEPNEWEHYERLFRDWTVALSARDPNSRYTELTPAHFDNIDEFMRRPGMRCMSSMAFFLNPDLDLPTAKLFARGGDVDSGEPELPVDCRAAYHRLIRRAEEIVDPWRRGGVLPDQEGGGEFGWDGMDTRVVTPGQRHNLRKIGETMRPGPIDNPNMPLFTDNEALDEIVWDH